MDGRENKLSITIPSTDFDFARLFFLISEHCTPQNCRVRPPRRSQVFRHVFVRNREEPVAHNCLVPADKKIVQVTLSRPLRYTDGLKSHTRLTGLFRNVCVRPFLPMPVMPTAISSYVAIAPIDQLSIHRRRKRSSLRATLISVPSSGGPQQMRDSALQTETSCTTAHFSQCRVFEKDSRSRHLFSALS